MKLAGVLLLFISLGAQAASIGYFYDGDTVKIEDNGQVFKLRITDIDAPERNQSYGQKSRRALMKLCQNTRISYQFIGTDKYQRRLGKLQCNQQDASLHMVQNGHAWFANRYSADHTLLLAQQQAQQAKLGLWQLENPMPPWKWRKNNRQAHTK